MMEANAPQQNDFTIQTDIKPKISEKRLEALRKGREEYHRLNREYKAILLAKKNEVVAEPPPVIVSEEPANVAKKEYKISFI